MNREERERLGPAKVAELRKGRKPRRDWIVPGSVTVRAAPPVLPELGLPLEEALAQAVARLRSVAETYVFRPGDYGEQLESEESDG